MAQIEQAAGSLDLTFHRGDEFSFQLDFGLNIAAYSFTAVSVFANSQGTQPFDIAVVSASAGTVQLTLSELETAGFPSGDHTWYMRQDVDNVRRTIITGTVVAL